MTREQFRPDATEPYCGLTAALTNARMPDLTLSGSVPQLPDAAILVDAHGAGCGRDTGSYNGVYIPDNKVMPYDANRL